MFVYMVFYCLSTGGPRRAVADAGVRAGRAAARAHRAPRGQEPAGLPQPGPVW